MVVLAWTALAATEDGVRIQTTQLAHLIEYRGDEHLPARIATTEYFIVMVMCVC